MNNSKSDSGNVLFIILLAVGLFAALAYAITSGRSTPLSAATIEQKRFHAEEMLQFGNGLRQVIDHMIIMEGVSDTNTAANGILFAATGADASYGVVGAQPKTEVFHSSGGKATYISPETTACSSACAYEFTGQATVTDVGSASPELAMVVLNVDSVVCNLINQVAKNGLTTIPTAGEMTLARFDGTNYGTNPITFTGGASEFVGLRSFCYRESAGAQRYIFVHVLRSR